MPYTVRCADTGATCSAVFTTETEDELMDHVRVHAAAAHPDLQITEETREAMKGLITQS